MNFSMPIRVFQLGFGLEINQYSSLKSMFIQKDFQLMKKHISILGSTGSIGINALKIADSFQNIIKIENLTANSNFELLIEQTKNTTQDQFV